MTILISSSVVWQLPSCEAQDRSTPSDYDYYSLALASVSESAREASKLTNIPQRIRLLLRAARVLAPVQHEEALRLLDVALGDVKKWASEDRASWYQRHTAAILRNSVLAVYAKLDPDKGSARRKQFEAEAEPIDRTNDTGAIKSDAWYSQFSNRRTIADQSATIGLSLVDSDPDKTLGFVVQSLQEGTVSAFLIEIVEKLIRSGKREFLTKLEIGIAKVLATKVTLDPLSLSYSSALLQTDKEMPTETRKAIVNFFLRSLQSLTNLVADPSEAGRIDTSFISMLFTTASLSVRPAISQYAPEQSDLFEQALARIAPLVPIGTRSQLQAFQPEKFSEPRDRLHDISSDPSPDRRDLRLVRFLAELLASESGDVEKNFDIAADVIDSFSDPDVKAAYADLLTITRMDTLSKKKQFVEAQQLAPSISSEDSRAWALLALSRVAVKEAGPLGFELITNALKILDTASPSPQKVELALIAAAMLAKNDPQRAFETFSAASRYANSSALSVKRSTKPPVGFGLEATIGESRTSLGVVPESLGELKPNSSLSILAIKDWFRADQIVNDFREPSLRLQLKLEFAAAVMAQTSKRKPETQKPTDKD